VWLEEQVLLTAVDVGVAAVLLQAQRTIQEAREVTHGMIQGRDHACADAEDMVDRPYHPAEVEVVDQAGTSSLEEEGHVGEQADLAEVLEDLVAGHAKAVTEDWLIALLHALFPDVFLPPLLESAVQRLRLVVELELHSVPRCSLPPASDEFPPRKSPYIQ
jgi:hypothetical protein